MIRTSLILAGICLVSVLTASNVEAAGRKLILLDPQYSAASDQDALGATRVVNPRFAIVGERLRAHLAASDAYVLVEDPAVAKEIDNYNIGACGRCELMLGRKAGADVVAVASVQEVSPMLINLQVFLVEVADGAILGAGGTVIHADTETDWRRGIDYVAEKRLKLPRVS